MKQVLLRLWTAVFLAMLLAVPTLAADRDASVSLPVSQTVTLTGGAKASEAEVRYTLSAEDVGAPMPIGAKDGVYSFVLTGTETITLPAITADAPGEWHYTLTAESTHVSLAVKSVSITLTAMQSADGLELTAVVKLPSGEKTTLDFTGSMGKTTPTPAPTPKVTPKPSGTPRTGDERPVLLAAITVVVSAAVMLLALARYRKQRREDCQ